MRYALDRYSAVRSGTEPPTKAELPTREDFAAVYLRLKRAFPDRKGSVCLHTLLRAMNETPGPAGPISYQKLRLTLDVLADAGVLRIEETDPASPGREVFSVALPNLDQKVNLETSCLYKQLTTETITPISKNCS